MVFVDSSHQSLSIKRSNENEQSMALRSANGIIVQLSRRDCEMERRDAETEEEILLPSITERTEEADNLKTAAQFQTLM